MTHPDNSSAEASPLKPSVSVATTLAAPAATSLAGYGRPFWFAYLANTCLMMAISLLFRYSDFVKVFGGTELQLGWITGIGMVGSLSMRVAQAIGIDRYGPRRIWLLSVAAFVGTCFAHLTVTTANGPWIYALHIAHCTAVAGAFGSSITYISSRVPVLRVAEVIGTLGTSGFLGMMLGSLLGDVALGNTPGIDEVQRMFILAGSLGVLSWIGAALATRGHVRPAPRKQPNLWWLVRRYHPGWLLLVAMAVGMGVGLPGVYLRPYCETLSIGGMAVFFWVYAPTAFATRLLTRRYPAKFGIRPMILLGLASISISMLLYLQVHDTWQLALPAIFGGIGHGFLFPSVTGGGSTAFPRRFRGLGVTLMLSMFDIGGLVGRPAAGTILKLAEDADWPPYATMFVVMAIIPAVIAMIYAGMTKGSPPPGSRRAPMRRERKPLRTQPCETTAGAC